VKISMFQTPYTRPERTPREVFHWAVDQAVAADQAGFSEYLIGEHATLDWESIPNPELVVATCARETEHLTLGPLAHLLPYHHPATLAVQTAWLSRVLEGRYMMGVATGAYPSDAALRGITDMSVNRAMMDEALEIMEKVWKAEPFHYEGQFWRAGYPEAEHGTNHHQWRDISPYGGSITMATTGLSEVSASIAYAGSHGWIPISVYGGDAFLKRHWQDYEAAATAAGFTPDRSMHHVVRDVVVAETDAAARKLALEGGVGRAWGEYLLPTYKRFGIVRGFLHDPDMNPDDVDLAYLAEHNWIVGSVDTVVEKIQRWQDDQGGFGTLMIWSHDYADNPEPWVESMNLLAKEVAPRINVPAASAVGA
jgi:alkanesulfonate monooxygenase SsuD/methylene tetrahydromethanopterin reductase-like flavin-dependent oxidoreductase (luciferase family)